MSWGEFTSSVGEIASDPLKAIRKGAEGVGEAFDRASSVPDPDLINTKKLKDKAETATIGTPTALPSTQIARQAPAFDAAQAGQASTSSAANPYLQSNLEMLQKLAAGQGGSVAQNQLQQGREANIAATMAQAASQRGGFNPLLARQALQSGAAQNAQANQQAANLRLQEQMAATGQIAQQGTAMRGQDIGVSQANAQMQTQTSLANTQAQLQQALAQGQISAQQANQIYQTQAQAMAATEQLRAQYMQMGYSAEQANMAAKAANAAAESQNKSAILGGVANIAASFIPGMMAAGPVAAAAAPAATGSISTGALSQGMPARELGGIMAAHGGVVPGKAPKEGDHPENDIVPARLSPGEFVLPRSLTSDKELMALVHKKMAEHQVKKSGGESSNGFAEVLRAQAELSAKIDALKKHMGGK